MECNEIEIGEYQLEFEQLKDVVTKYEEKLKEENKELLFENALLKAIASNNHIYKATVALTQ